MSHSCAYNIPLLENDGSNFAAWKVRAKTVLDLHDLWTIIDGTLPRPSRTTPLADHIEWSTKNREARAQIILTLKDEPLDTIIDAKTAAECWDRLLQQYEGRGIQRMMQYLDDIFRATFTDLDPLEPQINLLLKLACIVWNLGSKLGDDIMAAALISVLPSSLGPLKTVLANLSEGILPNELKAQILADEQCRIWESGVGATAFFAKASKKTKESKKEKDKEKAKKHCTHCDICGHDVSECWKLKKEQEAEGNAKLQGSNSPSSKTTTSKDSTTTSANVAVALPTTQPVVHLFKALALPRKVNVPTTKVTIPEKPMTTIMNTTMPLSTT